jgi:hypothetical protein
LSSDASWGPTSGATALHACRHANVHERQEATDGHVRVRYVFANQKGGVGKTTISLGIAAALAERGARVVVIDLDPQASATKVLGVDVEERCTMADALLEPDRYAVAHTVARTEWGFDVAPAEMALASRESRRSAVDEFVLRRRLETVSGYDVALVDCPPSLGVMTVNALSAASRLVLVTEPSFLALQGIFDVAHGGRCCDPREPLEAHFVAHVERGADRRWRQAVVQVADERRAFVVLLEHGGHLGADDRRAHMLVGAGVVDVVVARVGSGVVR